jgi:hypothetical protein
MSANFHLASRAERVALTARLVAKARAGERSHDERGDHAAAITAMWDEITAQVNAEFAGAAEREKAGAAEREKAGARPADAAALWDAVTKELNAERRRGKRQVRAA